MATTLKYGSSGDEVKKLQETLNAQGNYNLATDGKFGAKTQEAVKAYQKANGLSVDGIVGNNTWGALNKASTPSTAPSTTPSATPTTPKFEYADFAESDNVKKWDDSLLALGDKPVGTASQFQNSLQETIDKIMNREKFSYDLNGDALYQQYKDQYTTQGQMAMMDTMGQAAALTGGYGNSYASTAGNQAYQGHLQQLNNKIPELYQLALNQYNQEGQDLYNQYALIGDQADRAYRADRDAVSDWNAERDYLTNMRNSERAWEYGVWEGNRNFDYNVFSDERANEWQQKDYDLAMDKFNFEKDRAAVDDDHWQKQYDLSKKSASSSGGGGGGSTNTKLLGGWSEKDFTSAMREAAEMGDKDYAMSIVIAAGGTSAAYEIYDKYFGSTSEGIDTTVNPLKNPIKAIGGGRGYRVDMIK